MIDAVHGEERALAGMIPIDDSGDQGVVVLVGDEVSLAPNCQYVAPERLPGRAQVLVGELAKEGQLRS